MDFTSVKNNVWVVYDVFAAWLARRSMPVRKIGYGFFGAILWIAYILPGSSIRKTFAALASLVDYGNPTRLFRGYVRGLMRGMNRIEQLRHGYTDSVEAMFDFPEEARLRALLEKGGVVMVFPHTHSNLAMGRGLSQLFPLLFLVRSTTNEKRAASEKEIYDHMGSEFLDVRFAPPAVVARQVLKKLKGKGLVLGTVDRINFPPPEKRPIDTGGDLVRVEAFGEAVGMTGWPARFTARASGTILPAYVVQTEDKISLRLGPEVTPTDDLRATTQAWTDEMMALIRANPEEWTFALDKHWSRTLKQAVAT